MSRVSQKSNKSNRSSVRDAAKQKNYKVYAIQFHGSGLEAIRMQFKKSVQSGLRRTVYVIDLDEELEHSLSARREVQKKPSRGPSIARLQDLNSLAVAAIERCRRHYQNVMTTLELERQFDLLKYWQDELDAQTVATRLTKRRSQLAPKTAGTLPQTAQAPGAAGATNRGQRKTAGRRTLEKQPSIIDTLAQCMVVKRKNHNTVGAPEVLSKRKYINDEPADTKLFIILIGNLTIQLYVDLLRRNEPLQAIIDFLPEMNAYDLMIPHPQVHEFIVNTFGQIHWGIEEFRKVAITKPVGVFHQQLPVISTCLAEKYASEIYSQLTWYVYDVEVLYRQYLDYYVKPYHEVNVAMDKAVQLENLQETAESLSIQGHYLRAALPACSVDPATIYMYWDSLLSIFQQPIRLLTSDEAFMLTQPSKVSICYAETHSDSNLLYKLQAYQNAFRSITKIKRFERIFVEQNNELLASLIAYCDQKIYLNVYNSCLEYNLLRQYLSTEYTRGSMDYHAYSNNFEPIYLPRYAKFHATGDGVNQKLASLVDSYDSYAVEEIYPGHMLYTFQRTYNEIFEHEKLTLVPTKLCFRDFTIYQKDEFLSALVTPEMRRLELEAALTAEEHVRRTLKNEHIEFDLSIFVRPSSLKARQAAVIRVTQAAEKLRDSGSQLSKRNVGSQRESKRRTATMAKEATLSKQSLSDFVGLPPDHPLLYGYNLENVRQEIFTRVSKYHFKEGMLKLYEERWNTADMNAHVELALLDASLTIKRHRRQPACISKDLRLVSKSNISMRLKTAADQCSKVVLNYPNGLTVSHEGTTVHQVWSLTETHNDEHLRVYTPHGAVIIFLNGNDVITVLRYNGEMYQLLQYELISDEEEAGGEEEDTGAGIVEGTERSAEIPDAVGGPAGGNKVTRKPSGGELRGSKVVGGGGGKRKSKSSSSLSLETAAEPPTKTTQQKLADSIAGEYTFIEQIMAIYNLSYLHLRIITTRGRVVNITQKGKIYQTHENHMSEWQDYASNECYALREDGLKMVWTEDCLRCYHIDGTVMVSYLREECWELSDFEFSITPSSSHLSEGSEDQPTQPEVTYVEADSSLHSTGGANDYIKYLNRDAEEASEKDTSYITFQLDTFGLYNEHYVAVLITPFKCNLHLCNELDVRIKLMAVDDISIELMPEVPPPPPPPPPTMIASKESLRNTRGSLRRASSRLQRASSAAGVRAASAARITYEKLSATLDQLLLDDHPPPTRYQILVNIGKNFLVELHDDYFEVEAKVERNECEEMASEPMGEEQSGEQSEEQTEEMSHEEWGEEEEEERMSDKLVLRVEYDKDVIPNLFHSFVEKISQFQNCPGPKQDTFYFLEKRNPDCCYQGYELFDELPPTTGQVFHISNTVTELNTLKTMNDRMLLPYEHYCRDMKKFPRFHKRVPQPKKKLYEDYPVVTCVNIYLKIPQALSNTEDILKFINPLDETTFKRTRRVIKRALDYFLRPEIELSVRILASHKNWERRLLQHRRRLFTIDQRRGLYQAMLKHKNYPKYQHFVQDFSAHAKYIDFFDFMKFSCMDKELSSGDQPPPPTVPPPPAEPEVVEVERKPRVQYMT